MSEAHAIQTPELAELERVISEFAKETGVNVRVWEGWF